MHKLEDTKMVARPASASSERTLPATLTASCPCLVENARIVRSASLMAASWTNWNVHRSSVSLNECSTSSDPSDG